MRLKKKSIKCINLQTVFNDRDELDELKHIFRRNVMVRDWKGG